VSRYITAAGFRRAAAAVPEPAPRQVLSSLGCCANAERRRGNTMFNVSGCGNCRHELCHTHSMSSGREAGR
jgi:hypothetical protein